MASSIKEKSVKAVSWNLIERFGLQGIKFVLGIVLARLLTPEDFGLIGMITVFFAVAQVFISSGFGAAYIQKKEVTDVDANTVFFTNLAVSIVLYGVLWLAAPAIANFYEQPELIGLTRVMGLILLINAFNVIQIAQVTRNVDFKRKTKVTLLATILSGTVGITAACYNYGVWSLVIQQMTNRFLTTTGLWITNKWAPSLQFSKESFKSMFSYGAWILGSGIIKTVFDNIYILTIGKFFPAAQLGFYTKSKQFQSLASKQLSGAVGTVAFPVFSQLQDNKKRLQNGVNRFLTHTLIFTIPILITLMVVAKPFVILLLTEKWAPMIPYLQLLCIVGLLVPIHAVNIQVLMAQGKSNLNFRLTIIKNGLRIINIFAMYRFGVMYIIMGEIFVSLIALIINTYYTNKLIHYGLLNQIKDIKEIFAGGLIAGIIAYFVSNHFNNLWIVFFIGSILTIIIYLLIQYIINRKLLIEILNLRNDLRR
jgi:teichuronic acid exporter